MDLSHGSLTQRTGNQAELVAAQYLQQRGFKIVERNVLIGNGELDIVAQKNKQTIFVEVKARRSVCYGLAEESVTPTKVKRLRSAMQAYIIRENLDWNNIQLDVVTLIFQNNNWIIDQHLEDVLM